MSGFFLLRPYFLVSAKFGKEKNYFVLFFLDLPYLESCNVLKLNEKWITVECILSEEESLDYEDIKNLEFW